MKSRIPDADVDERNEKTALCLIMLSAGIYPLAEHLSGAERPEDAGLERLTPAMQESRPAMLRHMSQLCRAVATLLDAEAAGVEA